MTSHWQDKAKRLLERHGRHILILFVIVLLVHDVFGTHGFLAMQKKQEEIHKVDADLDRLNKENAQLERDARDLKSDPQTIRKIAREELGLAQPGEVIIKLPAQTPTELPAAKP